MSGQFYLAPAAQTYRQTIFDVIRIFFPDFQWAKTEEESVLVDVETGEQTWRLQIGSDRSVFSVQGLDENQRRRLLKQQVYHRLQKMTGQAQHPWGIMTGIRPTKIVHRERDAGLSEAAIGQKLQSDYLVHDEKTRLLLEVTRRQRPFLLDKQQAKALVSIYVSIPFCPTRCAYCSFPSFCLPKPALQEAYLANLLAECQAVGQALSRQQIQIQTVYIGGGTPTSLSAAQLERVLSGVQQYLGGASLAEFTVEAGRPDTISLEKLQLLHDYGVGRISINPQTFSQATLQAIGRRHTVQQLLDVYAMARQVGFDSINMDLITGLPGETAADFAHSLEQIAQLQPENLTVHTLAIKRTAALQLEAMSQQQGQIVQQMQGELRQWLTKQRYGPYYLYRQKHMVGDQENVGYCLPGKESIYNIQMMEERQTILGLGVGSASKYVNPDDWTLQQTNNPKDLYDYNQRIEELINKKIARIGAM